MDIKKMVFAYEEERAKYIGGAVYYPHNQAAFEGAMKKAIAAGQPNTATHTPDKIAAIPRSTAAYAAGNKASKQAAQKQEPKLHKNRLKVLEFIKSQDTKGATGSEIAKALDMLPYTAKPRCTELKDMGKIFDSNMTRKNENGQPETVWMAE